MIKSFLVFWLFFFKWFHLKYFHLFGCKHLDCVVMSCGWVFFFPFSYKIVCKMWGLVSHISLSTGSEWILSLFTFSLPRWEFLFLKTQRCQFLLLYLITTSLPGLPPATLLLMNAWQERKSQGSGRDAHTGSGIRLAAECVPAAPVWTSCPLGPNLGRRHCCFDSCLWPLLIWLWGPAWHGCADRGPSERSQVEASYTAIQPQTQILLSLEFLRNPSAVQWFFQWRVCIWSFSCIMFT